MVPAVLQAVGVQVEGDGSAEYAQMDREYRGTVRFQQFHRYVMRNQRRPNPWNQATDAGGDEREGQSGASSDDQSQSDAETEEDAAARSLWEKLDPMHRCYVHIDRAIGLVGQEIGKGDQDKKAEYMSIITEMEKKSDSFVTFQEFRAFLSAIKEQE